MRFRSRANPRPCTKSMLTLFLLSFIGVASPFALGSVEVSSSTLYSSPSSKNLLKQPQSTVAQSAVSQAYDTQTPIPKSLVRRFLSNLNPLPGRKDSRWRGGETTASLASRLLFSYVVPLLDLARERTLSEQDSFPTAESNLMQHSVAVLGATYEKARTRAQKSIGRQRQKGKDVVKKSQSLVLLMALIRQQRRLLILTGVLRLCNTGIQAFPSILVARLLRCIEAGQTIPATQAVQSAVLLVTVLTTKMITENQLFHNMVKMSTQTRGSLEGLIFEKSLRLPDGGSGVVAEEGKDKEKEALGTGGVLNLMQSDASIVESAAMQVHTTWDGPLQIIIYTSLLFRYLGPSVLWGIAALLTVIPLNSITLRILDRLSRHENDARDARTKRTTEAISHMKLLKLQAWEYQFAGDVRRHRTDEINRHKMRGVVRAVNSSISNAVPALVLVVTLTAYAKSGRPFVASTIFTAISLFNQLRFPLFFLPMLVDSLTNGKNALRRISSYLTSEELTPYVEKLPAIAGGSIEMRNGNFLWSTSQSPKEGEVMPPEAPALCNVNLRVNPGEIVAVVGPVGSGKSALIRGLLGELTPVPRAVVDDTGGNDHGSNMMDRPSVQTHGQVAYCPQEAWLPKGTMQDAIVFGRDYDEKRYLSAIFDAGLDKDVSDGTLDHLMDVGEGGSNLSGGQRARVALARALYGDSDTKVFLLDDCFAALDASVGSMVFERVSRRLRCSNTAAVIVTNDPSLPRRCDRVVLMGPTSAAAAAATKSSSSCSTIVDTGTYDDLLARGHSLKSFDSAGDEDDDELAGEISHPHVDIHVAHADDCAGNLNDPNGPEMIRVIGGYKVKTNGTDNFCPADMECHEADLQSLQNYPDYMENHVAHPDDDTKIRKPSDVAERGDSRQAGADKSETPARAAKMLSTDETMSKAAVPFSTYMNYLKAVRSPLLIVAMLAAFATVSGAQFFQQYTVARWTELAQGNEMAAALGTKYLRSLLYAAGVVSVFLWLRSYLIMLVGSRASTLYHDKMVSSVFRAPMSFFDATPSGQLLTRFGKEIGTIDRALPDSITSVIFCALQISSSAMALAGAITPAMLIPLTLVGSLYLRIVKKFRPAARDMKRSDIVTRSPIFTHFGEALRGTEVIRSIPGASLTWTTQHQSLVDKNLAVYSTVKALDRWLSYNLEGLGNFMVLVTAVASVVLSRAGILQPGGAGWGLTQSLAITGLMAWAIRNLTMLESHMMSVMRVRELTDLESEEVQLNSDTGEQLQPGQSSMPKELTAPGEALQVLFPDKVDFAVSTIDDRALQADGWPWKGGIKFNKVSMRYNPAAPLVLKELNIDVPAGTTLGVVGRSGSGKSSLLLTLFRIVEVESGGRIEIDGVDIRSVSMKTLRSKLAIIPQDPVLFAGTVAFNLDATGNSTEADMWEALEAASPELASQFKKSGTGLETIVNEGGNNFSQGQRQLICLARALLRKSKILVMDEATSSVDPTTDQQVQGTIKRQFVDKGVTVLTVAHRLETVLGYDKIAVLGDGELLEYGSPDDLLKISDGEFRRLVDADRESKRKGGRKAATTVA